MATELAARRLLTNGDARIPFEPLGAGIVVQLKRVSALGFGSHGSVVWRGKGDAAIRGHDRFGLDAELEEAQRGLETA